MCVIEIAPHPNVHHFHIISDSIIKRKWFNLKIKNCNNFPLSSDSSRCIFALYLYLIDPISILHGSSTKGHCCSRTMTRMQPRELMSRLRRPSVFLQSWTRYVESNTFPPQVNYEETSRERARQESYTMRVGICARRSFKFKWSEATSWHWFEVVLLYLEKEFWVLS